MNNRTNMIIISAIFLCSFGAFICGCSHPINGIDQNNVITGKTVDPENKPSSSIDETSGMLSEVGGKLTLSEPDDYTSQGTGIVRKESDIKALFNALEIVEVSDSTCFSAIGYSKADEIFYCRFLDSGSEYIYLDVPYSVYKELMVADSKGGYFNKQIKPYYECLKIERCIS